MLDRKDLIFLLKEAYDLKENAYNNNNSVWLYWDGQLTAYRNIWAMMFDNERWNPEITE